MHSREVFREREREAGLRHDEPIGCDAAGRYFFHTIVVLFACQLILISLQQCMIVLHDCVATVHNCVY